MSSFEERIQELEKEITNLRRDYVSQDNDDISYNELICAFLFSASLADHKGDMWNSINTLLDKLDLPISEFTDQSDLTDQLEELGFGYKTDDHKSLHDFPDYGENNE